MQLKTFIAPTMQDAMRQIRLALGDDAVIISTTRLSGDKGFKLTAATEREEDTDWISQLVAEAREEAQAESPPPTPVQHAKPASGKPATQPQASRSAVKPATQQSTTPRHTGRPLTDAEKKQITKVFAKALHYHNAPEYLLQQLNRTAEHVPSSSLEYLFVDVLQASFDFEPLPLGKGQDPLMFIGPTGAGKTMSAAKLATSCVLQDIPVILASTDHAKPAGVEQLGAFADILGTRMLVAHSPEELASLIKRHRKGAQIIIDSYGVNAFDKEGLQELGHWISCSDIEPVLVLPAGMDAADAADIAANFAYLGTQRVIFTKLDAARRLGSLLTATHAGNFKISHFSKHPGAVDPLHPMSAEKLAQLLLQYHAQNLIAHP